MTIRPARAADRAAIARVCLLTGQQGADATGLFGDDETLADVYALPYLEGPGCFCLVWEADAGVSGYVLGTVDTEAFQRWFVDEWWPRAGVRHERCTPSDAWLLDSARDPRRMLVPECESYPAHLHIDLLPSQQGRGAGRALMEAACAALAAQGVRGVHVVTERANGAAQAFYPRVGFEAARRDDATVTFVRSLGERGDSRSSETAGPGASPPIC